MELLYLWIEDYKNIHHQGFNFSPKYRFEFTPEFENETKKEKVKGGKLYLLDSNGNRILNENAENTQTDSIYDNFFEPSQKVKDAWMDRKDDFGKPLELGKITNITAIIGENGAGKSNLLEFIEKLNGLWGDKKAYLIIISINNKYYLIQNHIVVIRKHFSIFADNLGLFSDFNISIYDKDKTTLKQKINFILNNKLNLTLPFNLPNTINFKLIFDNIDVTSEKVFFKDHYEENLTEFEGQPIRIQHFSEADQIILNFIFPEKSNYLEESLLSKKLKIKDRLRYDILKNFILNFYYDLYCFLPTDNHYREKFFNAIADSLNNRSGILSQNYFQDFENKAITFLDKASQFIADSDTSKLEFREIRREGYERPEEIFDSFSNISKDVKTCLSKLERIKLVDENNEISFDSEIIFELELTEFKNFKRILDSFDHPRHFFKIDYFWRNLSAGELALLSIYTALALNTNSTFSNHINLILIDEGETGFHPEWQRKYLKYLIDFFPQIYPDKQIQIILTTHSPFLASDLPKENIIFLQKAESKTEEEKKGNYEIVNGVKYENGKCIVVDGLKKDKTFGANIHTLLSDSFFLEDGLIGEFAKGKINEIIDFYKRIKRYERILSKNEALKNKFKNNRNRNNIRKSSNVKILNRMNNFWKIQKMVGEEYIAQIIKNHLEELDLILLEKDIALNEKMNRLTKELEALKAEKAKKGQSQNDKN
ncbi:MAG: AAA family ATPase [Leptospiraceae bacterium]|nr:AAA family ATPase [Leptospiraceae bacterium]